MPASSSASPLAGLTNESLSGRHRWEMPSSATAAASCASGPASHRPNLAAAPISGTDRPHSVDRGMPAEGTGTNGARACSAKAASGDPAPPTPISRQPRRTASSAAASVSSVDPEQDTPMTRSEALTQPGSW